MVSSLLVVNLTNTVTVFYVQIDIGQQACEGLTSAVAGRQAGRNLHEFRGQAHNEPAGQGTPLGS